MSVIPRFVHHVYAAVGGYFWIRCEDCGKGFGGHQWDGSSWSSRPYANDPHRSHAAFCPRCAHQRQREGRVPMPIRVGP